MIVDIFKLKPGSKIRFSYPNNGYDYEILEASKLLTVGNIYIVKSVDIHSSSTEIYLEGFHSCFNCVMFSDVKEYTSFSEEGRADIPEDAPTEFAAISTQELLLPMAQEHIDAGTDFKAIDKAVSEYAQSIGVRRIHVTPAPGASAEAIVNELKRFDDHKKAYNEIPLEFRQKFMIDKLKKELKGIQRKARVAYSITEDPNPKDMKNVLMDIWSTCDMLTLTDSYPSECIEAWNNQNV